MSTNALEEQSLRRYLLGKVTDENALRDIEERLLEEANFQEELSIAESVLIDEYVLDTLLPDERDAFDSYFLAHPARREQLRLTRALHAYAQKENASAAVAQTIHASKQETVQPSWLNWLFRPPIRTAAFAVLLIVLSVGVWRIFIYQSAAERATTEIAAAFPQEGPLEVRVTGLNLNPPPNTRGLGDKQGDAEKLRHADNLLIEARPDAAVLHAKGKLALVRKNYDEAVKQLEAALRLDPDNPQLHADLGATLLAKSHALKAGDEQKSQLLWQSYEHLKQALDNNRNSLEIRFNYAFCLQEQRLFLQAREAWQEYLKRDSDSQWAESARNYLKQLDNTRISIRTPDQILQDFMVAFRQKDNERAWQILSQTREMITGRMVGFQLIRRFLVADARGQPDDARDALAALSYAGALEQAHGGDPFFTDLANYYSTSSTTQKRLSNEAYGKLSIGFDTCFNGATVNAVPFFQEAKSAFMKAGNLGEASVVDYWIIYNLPGQAEQLLPLLNSLKEFCHSKKYTWLESQTHCLAAQVYRSSGEYSKSLSENQEALALAIEVSDTYNQQKCFSQIGEEYRQRGDAVRALNYLFRSLSLPAYYCSARQMSRNYAFTILSLYTFNFYHAAAAFGQESLALSLSNPECKSFQYSAYTNLGSIYAALQQYDQAFSFAETGLSLSQSNGTAPNSQNLRAYSTLQLAHLQRQAGNCSQAISNYNEVIKVHEQLNLDAGVENYAAHKGRLLCYLALNLASDIDVELPLVINQFENARLKIIEEQDRNSFFDKEQSVYDAAINYELSRQNYEQAFNYSETSRSRSLLELLHNTTGSAPTKPEELQSIRAQMPAQTQIVQYAVLPDRLVIWVISSPDKFVTREQHIPLPELEAKIAEYLNLITTPNVVNETTLRKKAAELYAIVISPIESSLDPNKEICFVPDKKLFYLPFASLVSPDAGKYLVENHTSFSSPSANVFLLCSKKAQAKLGLQSETLLSIGNPAFDTQEHESLTDLPNAEQEARDIAQIYSGAEPLLRDRAVKNLVLSRMAQAEILHFAGHYLLDERTPMQSKLLLAKEPNAATDAEPDLLTADLLEKKLPRAKLVVLSACSTGIGRYHNGEGMVGLARAFLATGVPLVVASQWQVESSATAELMVAFHGYRKTERLSTALALRRAQMNLLHGADEKRRHPYFWAAFAPIGGYTAY